MDDLMEYISLCYRPRDSSEFAIVDEFNDTLFESLKEDGIMVASTQPVPKSNNMECIKIGKKYLIKKASRRIQWFDEQTKLISFDSTNTSLYRRLLPRPNPETVNHTKIILDVLIEYKSTLTTSLRYVEFGVRDGTSLFAIAPAVEIAYGVDIRVIPSSTHTNIKRFQMYTTEFSEKYLPNISFNAAFIDADHSSDSAMKDFDFLFKYIEEGGYIFLHDTYPCEEWLLAPRFCNDCYLTPIRIHEKYGTSLELLTLPLNPGITIVRKISK